MISTKAAKVARHLLHVFPSFSLGGSQARLISLIEHFGGRYRHSVVSLNSDISAAETSAQALQLSFITAPSTLGCLPRRLRQYRAQIGRIAPDLLLTYNWGAIEYAMANFPRLVSHVHVEDGFGPEEAQARIRRRSLIRGLVLRANRSRLVVPSQSLVNIAVSEWHLQKRRVQRIVNGVAPDKYGRADLRDRASRYAREPGEIVVGIIAGLRPEKALDLLIEAVAIARARYRLRLVIAGSGPLDVALKQLCREKGYLQWVEFLGFVADPSRVYLELDIFALSSKTEQLPISMIEAMLSGLPVASSDVGDIRSSLPAIQHGLLCRQDADALASAIATLAASAELRFDLGRANQQHAREAFSAQPMFAAWDEILRS